MPRYFLPLIAVAIVAVLVALLLQRSPAKVSLDADATPGAHGLSAARSPSSDPTVRVDDAGRLGTTLLQARLDLQVERRSPEELESSLMHVDQSNPLQLEITVVALSCEGGMPIPGAKVYAQFPSFESHSKRGTTNQLGCWTVSAPLEDGAIIWPSTIRIEARGRATVWIGSSSPVQRPSGATEVELEFCLERSAPARVRVLAEGRPLSHHQVSFIKGAESSTQASGGYEKLEMQYGVAFTGTDGIADLDGLSEGTWVIYVPQWRGHDSCPRQAFKLERGTCADIELHVEPFDKDSFVAGKIHLQHYEAADEDGTLAGWLVEVQRDEDHRGKRGANRHVAHEGGRFHFDTWRDGKFKIRAIRVSPEGDVEFQGKWLWVEGGQHQVKLVGG